MEPLKTSKKNPKKTLTEFVIRSGYFRIADKEKKNRLGKKYHKGYEVRIGCMKNEIVQIQNICKKAHIKAGKPYKKTNRYVVPIYGAVNYHRINEWLLKYYPYYRRIIFYRQKKVCQTSEMMEKEKSIPSQVFKKMAAICSRSEQCSPDIRKKIMALGLENETAGEIIEMLKDEKYIDDERYAKAYAIDKFRINKWGKIKIRYFLKSKGLPDETIQTGLDQIAPEKYKTVLVKILKDKAKTVKKSNRFEKMGQVIRFAQSRGFEPELIHRYMDEVVK